MRRRAFIAALSCAAVPAIAQQSDARTPRIGYISPGPPNDPAGRRNRDALRQGLNDLGLVEGQNIKIEYRFADRNFDRLPELAAELVRLNVTVIVAGPTPAAVAAWHATRTIPIVMINVGDPVGLGLVASLARPGGNVTGLSFTVGTETFGKGLELFKEAVPGLHRVAVLVNPANPAHALVLRDIQVVARALGLELRPFEARSVSDLEGAFSIMAEQRVDGVYVIPDVLFFSQSARLTDLRQTTGWRHCTSSERRSRPVASCHTVIATRSRGGGRRHLSTNR
jgi:putative ABC transport system substrate-binding protein